MSSTLLGQRIAAVRRLPLPWLTVGALAVLMAVVDTFWLTSLQGAIGAIERSQGPFNHWLRGLVVMVPLFAVVIVWVVSRAGRRYGDAPRGTRATLGAHVKGLAYVGGLEAGSNLLLVGWVLAARGAGWAPSRRAGRKLDRQGAGAASASATV